ncbi:MAG TPA: hypothetical protein VIV60_10365 [Polyangiaceae bacterium]
MNITSKYITRNYLHLVGFAFALSLVGCEEDTPTETDAGHGGATNSEVVGRGGSTAVGATRTSTLPAAAGNVQTGGMAQTGGSVQASGSHAGDEAQAGANTQAYGGAATGSTAQTGGAPAVGGSVETGGAAHTGGNAQLSGTAQTGGALAAGGSAQTGGVAQAGGAVAAGGSEPTNSTAPTGGVRDVQSGGGHATGGTSLSGGGTATGGVVVTGGTTSTGGAEQAGAAGSSGVIEPICVDEGGAPVPYDYSFGLIGEYAFALSMSCDVGGYVMPLVMADPEQLSYVNAFVAEATDWYRAEILKCGDTTTQLGASAYGLLPASESTNLSGADFEASAALFLSVVDRHDGQPDAVSATKKDKIKNRIKSVKAGAVRNNAVGLTKTLSEPDCVPAEPVGSGG